MPVSYLPSAEQLVDRQKTTAKKRRRNQNAEIDELAKLLPIKPLPTPATPFLSDSDGEASSRAKANQAVDKISVLRITSTFLKFQEFLSNGYFSFGESAAKRPNINNLSSDLLADAMDGFLIALDKDATILYASESITSYIGLTQQDVIGQCLIDITHPDDKELIKDNLTPKAILPPGITNKGKDTQPRQFYIRFKSTMSPGRVQLSRFNSYTMIQVTGNLKVREIDSSKPGSSSNSKEEEQRETVGFVGECRLIESTSSILEISIPQSYFTTTISMDMKIVSVESQMKELIGFAAEDFIGTRLRDYFHPADYTKLIPCEVMLMHTGHAVSPVFRFMSASGGWVWMQMEGILRYKPGTKERQFWEIKVKMVSQEEGHVALIEQNELYTPNSDPNQDLLNPHKDHSFLTKLRKASELVRGSDGPEPILRSLQKANLSGSLIDSVLHGREMGMSDLPGNVKQVLHPNQADDFKVQLKKSLADGTWGKTNLHFDGFEHVLASCPSSPPNLSSSAPSPNPTIVSSLSSTVTSDPSLVGQALPPTTNNGCWYPTATPPHMVGNCTHSDLDPSVVTGGNQPISYYSGSGGYNQPPGGVASPGSAYNSPYASPAPYYNHHDVRSPPSAAPSPASSLVSSVISSGPQPGPAMPPHSNGGFSFSPSQAISNTFGNISTDSIPNFTGAQFQAPPPTQMGSPHSAPRASDPEICMLLDDFENAGVPGNRAAPVEVAEASGANDVEFLLGLNEPLHNQNNSQDISYYDSPPPSNNNYDITATISGEIPYHHHHHHMTMLAISSAAKVNGGVAATSQGDVVMDNANLDQMDQILTQLINT